MSDQPTGSRGVDRLAFAGDQRRPTSLDDVYRADPVLPTAAQPADLVRMREQRSYYVSGEYGAQAAPDVHVEQVGEADEGARWRVDLPLAPGETSLALPGRSAVRSTPDDIVREVDPQIGVAGYRPEWIAASPTPRPVPGDGRPRPLRRLNGRPTTPLYVFPPDDRREYRDAAYPWGVVGKVFTSGGWTGTGALVGPRLMVTAGHVVPWGQSGWWMRFVPAYYNGTSLHGAGVESYVSDTRGYNPSGDVTGYDWAICRLYQPLGNSLGYFGYNGYSDDWRDDPYWTLLGYPGAVAGGLRPSWQGSVSVFDEDSDSNGGRELETRADATPGNSGGPLFGWWGNDPRVIGVVSGEETDWIFPFGSEMGNVVASGSGFTNLIAWGRTNWP